MVLLYFKDKIEAPSERARGQDKFDNSGNNLFYHFTKYFHELTIQRIFQLKLSHKKSPR